MKTQSMWLVAASMTIAAALSLSSCSEDEEQQQSQPIAISRFDKTLAGYAALDSVERQTVLNTSKLEFAAYAAAMDEPQVDDALALSWSTGPAVTIFQPEVDRLYADLKNEESALGAVMANADKARLALPGRKFMTAVWGREMSIGLCDTVVMIALNHYLGPLNPAYNGWPEYRRTLKTRDMIPYDVTEAMVRTAYPYAPTQDNVLARLLYEGAVARAKMELVPDADENHVFGYDPTTMKSVADNEAFMYKRLIGDNLLYSADGSVLQRLFDPAPGTPLLSPDAPGRAVDYLGWKIVGAYAASHPDKQLKDLLAPSFYANPGATLKESGYK